MKRLCSYIMIIMLLLSTLEIPVYADSNGAIPVSADSAVLIDAATGTILYSKNMDAAYAPASTTKTMTALLTLEKCSLDDSVVVGKKPPQADGSSIYLKEGEVLTVRDLLHGLLISSANDCAEALAEHIGGSIEEFAKLMNERAKQLGCNNTNFVNPSGLYNPNHKTSAHDLALIMRELVKHPEFSQISLMPFYKIPASNKEPEDRVESNRNKLTQRNSGYYYEGVVGAKTGYTTESLYSYVACAQRNGQKLIVALVHSKDNTCYEDTIKLFNYGFNNYELKKFCSKGDELSSLNINNEKIPLLAAEDFYYVRPKNATEIPTFALEKKDLSALNFKKGDVITQANMNIMDKPLGSLMLTSGVDHESSKLKVLSSKNTVTAKVFTAILYIFSALALMVFILLIRKRLRIFIRNRRRRIK